MCKAAIHDEMGNAVLAHPTALAALAAALHAHQRAVSLHVDAIRLLARAATGDAQVVTEEVAAAVMLAMQHLPGTVQGRLQIYPSVHTQSGSSEHDRWPCCR